MDVKLQGGVQMAGRYPQSGPCRRLTAQKGKKQQRAPGAHRAPPPQEEDPKVKCKDCGAFGHRASSVRCPMKRWNGALAPQALGSCRMKENVRPWTPRHLRAPGPVTRPEAEQAQRARPEGQRQALLQRFPRRPAGRPQPSWKEQAESCDYVRRPQRPMPVHTTQRKSVPGPVLNSHSTRPPAAQSVGQGSNLSVKAPAKRAVQTSTQACQNPQKKPRLAPCLPSQESPQGPDPQPARALLQAAQACPGPQLPAVPQGPGQPLRMVFTRLVRGQWSSRLLTAASLPPAEEPTPPAPSPPTWDKAGGVRVRVPLSVLYEDLQVSHSSEESDGQ